MIKKNILYLMYKIKKLNNMRYLCNKNNSIEEVIGEEMLTVMKEYQEKYRRR